MKLKELFESEQSDVEAEVRKFRRLHPQTIASKFKVDEVGIVNVEGYVDLRSVNLTEIPFTFGHVEGNFNCSGTLIKSLKNCPDNVEGYYSCNNCPALESLAHLPFFIGGNLIITGCNKITSLENTEDIFQELELQGILSMDFHKIKTGGLSLMLINGIQDLHSAFGSMPAPFTIIRKFLGTDNIIECQSELIEAGYEEYAVL